MKNKDIKLMEGVSAQNKRGEWVPAIEVPLYISFGRYECRCGRRFWSEEAYKGHYAYKHILAL